VGSYLYSAGLWKNEYLLALPVMAFIVLGIKHRKRLLRNKAAKEQ